MVDPPTKTLPQKFGGGVSKKVEGVTKKVGGSGPPSPTPQWLRPCLYAGPPSRLDVNFAEWDDLTIRLLECLLTYYYTFFSTLHVR